MGEIGLPRREFLHDLQWWEVHSIIRGYNRRHRDLWSSQRWSTYNIICAFVGSKELRDNGINNPTDLLHLPWDSENEPGEKITEEYVRGMLAEMDAINAANAENQQAKSDEP